jgi:hypothetical protein
MDEKLRRQAETYGWSAGRITIPVKAPEKVYTWHKMPMNQCVSINPSCSWNTDYRWFEKR